MRSAGLLPYRYAHGLEVLLAHPGGPYFVRRDDGWWSLVKGLVKEGESDEEAAAREFREETGWPAPPKPWIPLGETTLKSGKVVIAWAAEADFEPASLEPGGFQMGTSSFPEIDRVEWMSPSQARIKINAAQGVFVDRLARHLSPNSRDTAE